MRKTTRLARRQRSSDLDSGSDERGFVLVWFALLIFVMLGVTAFAVDLGHAYYVAQQGQDAADAAALSSASYLPDNCVNANPHAQSIAALNGFTNGVANTTVTAVNGSIGGAGCDADPSLSPNEIKVQVKRKIDTWFARAIGIDTITVNRTSVAEYDPPVALGSPTNYFGNPVGCTNCGPLPGIWASVDGRANRKVDGNAISAEWCSGNQTNGSSDNCDGNGRSNSDLDTDGMLFKISNPQLQSLNVELYDPGFIDVVHNPSTQSNCDFGITYPTCTGDSVLGVQNGANSTPRLATKYTLYPLDNLTNPLGSAPICSVTYPGYTDTAAAAAANDLTFRSHNRWANLATDAGCPALTGSSYVLQVQGADDISGTPQGGSNMFSVAACSGCAQSQPQYDPNVSISAITKMSIFTNSNLANPEFYLARVPSWAKGQTLNLTFFDIGDISNSSGDPIPGSLKVSAVDATHGPSGGLVDEFASCQYSNPAGRGNDSVNYLHGRATPWDTGVRNDDWTTARGVPLTDLSGCTAQVTINTAGQDVSFWNGKWVTFKVLIPSDYTCNDTDFTKCWLKIKYTYGPAAFHDATTWTASLSGNPVRLTK